ncbi:MAG: ribosome small subunit-dependent GTPase A [Planctomycetota bacterium]
MERNDKDELLERLLRGIGKEKSYEEKRRLRASSKAKRAARRREKPRDSRWDEDDDEPQLEEKLASAARLELPREIEFDDERPGEEAVVVAVDRARVRVRPFGTPSDGSGDLDRELEAVTSARDGAIAVGDRAVIERLAHGAVVVRALRTRSTRLSRPDPGDPRRERVIAANVDTAVIVVSVGEPAFKPAFVDRMLVAVQFGGVAPIVCVNKIERLEGGVERTKLDATRATLHDLSIPLVLASAHDGTGIDELRGQLSGKRCVFVGHSGVGKSSLFNALDPSSERATGNVRESDGRGRHTTTRSCLREVWPGTELVDTPGVRQFGLWGFERATLASYFPEFAAERCRFRDCSHTVEPACGVRAAVDAGRIAVSRLAVYVRLRAEIADD